ncbi:MAG TPA: metallophosphoesterase [Tepidiformaceae bacterium]|jgi:DNA repair exonuclease SbcCD nuclease subunit
MPDRRPLRVVHTSDVHLGAYSGIRDGHASERHSLMEAAFMGVIDLANREHADVLLIVGDLFDNDRVPDSVVHFAAAQIARFEGRTFLIPGNHDPMDPGKIYWRHDMEALAPRLTILREHAGQVVEAPELDLVIWGRAYRDSDWHFRPLAGLPGRQDHRWHIAMAHGHFVTTGGDMSRSLLMHESEIAAAAGNWDYLAFGHWEPHADVSTAGAIAVYSGAPMPLVDANTRAGWAAVVDFDAAGVRWRLHRVDPRPVKDAP